MNPRDPRSPGGFCTLYLHLHPRLVLVRCRLRIQPRPPPCRRPRSKGRDSQKDDRHGHEGHGIRRLTPTSIASSRAPEQSPSVRSRCPSRSAAAPASPPASDVARSAPIAILTPNLAFRCRTRRQNAYRPTRPACPQSPQRRDQQQLKPRARLRVTHNNSAAHDLDSRSGSTPAIPPAPDSGTPLGRCPSAAPTSERRPSPERRQENRSVAARFGSNSSRWRPQPHDLYRSRLGVRCAWSALTLRLPEAGFVRLRLIDNHVVAYPSNCVVPRLNVPPPASSS